MFTPYGELDALPADFTGSVREILGDTFVGACLQGSFALGAGDLHSDCDFVIAATDRPGRGGAAQAARRDPDTRCRRRRCATSCGRSCPR
ncbi:hypothetical protein ADK57_19820 [Streptomyces sp. MMG1533]|nr:hypothetical protein ADK57_19820 [Streptomyces sp. MMG1533]